MLEELIVLVNCIRNVITYSLYCSFKTGQFLVYLLNLLLNCTNIILKNVSALFLIILESLTVFLQDVLQGVLEIIDILGQIWDSVIFGFSSLTGSVNSVFYKIVSVIWKTYEFLLNSTLGVYALTISLFQTVKHLLVLFGAGVWFVLTLVPYSIIGLVHIFISTLRSGLQHIYKEIIRFVASVNDCVENIYIFVTDVPIESAIGLIIGVCLIYTFIRYYLIVYQYSRPIYINVLNKFRRRPTVERRNVRSERNYLRLPSNRRPHIRRTCLSDSISDSANDTPDERFCVICQERNKCVLILPCKHVCMCMECNAQLQLYNSTCPICRNDIESTMKIFV